MGSFGLWEPCAANCCGPARGCRRVWDATLRLTIPSALGERLNNQCSCDCDISGEYTLEHCDGTVIDPPGTWGSIVARNAACYEHLARRGADIGPFDHKRAATPACVWGLITDRTCDTSYSVGHQIVEYPYWAIESFPTKVRFELYAAIITHAPEHDSIGGELEIAPGMARAMVLAFLALKTRQDYPTFDPAVSGARLPDWYEHILAWVWTSDPFPTNRALRDPLTLRYGQHVITTIPPAAPDRGCPEQWDNTTWPICNLGFARQPEYDATIDAWGGDA